MAKIKKVAVNEDVVDEKIEEVVGVVEEKVEEPAGVFADTIDLTPKVAATVSMAIQQAADRLARDKANFPQL